MATEESAKPSEFRMKWICAKNSMLNIKAEHGLFGANICYKFISTHIFTIFAMKRRIHLCINNKIGPNFVWVLSRYTIWLWLSRFEDLFATV